MFTKKTTLQTAQMFVEGVTDENLKNRYGTSVNEYMSHEQSKKIQEKINVLRNEFAQIGKSKTSPITFNELVSLFDNKNVIKKYIIININFF
jgi:hypothetical protein